MVTVYNGINPSTLLSFYYRSSLSAISATPATNVRTYMLPIHVVQFLVLVSWARVVDITDKTQLYAVVYIVTFIADRCAVAGGDNVSHGVSAIDCFSRHKLVIHYSPADDRPRPRLGRSALPAVKGLPKATWVTANIPLGLTVQEKIHRPN